MAQIVEVVGLVVVLVVGAGAYCRRRAAGTREIARWVQDFRTFLDHVVAQEGRVALEEYVTDDRTLAMSEIQHLTRRAHDRKLRRHLVRALDAYDHSLALAPPSAAHFGNGDQVDSAEVPPDPLRDEQRVHQVESAEISRAAFGDALGRARRLDRWALRRS